MVEMNIQELVEILSTFIWVYDDGHEEEILTKNN